MGRFQLLLVAGTHGNEVNGPWLVEQWSKDSRLINDQGIDCVALIGNPGALEVSKRYLDRDLNRSFQKHLLSSTDDSDREIVRAREILSSYGPDGLNPCNLAVDIHSTTAAMGSSLVIYGRRAADLALAALVQDHLGLPVYLHEEDESQQGFLVESWPCGLVIEIGPVPQSVLEAQIVEKTRIVIESCFYALSKVVSNSVKYPLNLIVHRHLESLDFPKDSSGSLTALVHPEVQGKDWISLRKGINLFVTSDKDVVTYEKFEGLTPVFVNEAAYREKNIAMSLAKREVWPFCFEWGEALFDLVHA